MSRTLTVALVGQSGTRLDTLDDLLREAGELRTLRKLVGEHQSDPLAELGDKPDLIVLDLGRRWEQWLATLASGRAGQAAPLVVIGREGEPEMMRKAMQAGARDFFVSPLDEQELLAAIRRIGTESQMARRSDAADITLVINGKGGSGATFLSTSFATSLCARDNPEDASCTLLDMDLQFGNLPVYLDLAPNDHLFDALLGADSLDPIALGGLLHQHRSGVRVLASQPEEPRSLAEIDAREVQTLIGVLARLSAHLILDMPRVLDARTMAAIELADRVLVVTQQTVPHVRDAKFLTGMLRSLGVANNRISLIVNRYDRKGEVRLDDIEDAFPEVPLYTIENDYKRVSQVVNEGVPLNEKWPRAPITRSLRRTVDALWVPPEVVGARAPRRLFSLNRGR